jgi:catechol 2,3-dioxygenase-like lactoylglutathione lyase family enzyme
MILEGGARVASGYSFPDNEWHHYALTVDNSAQTVTFYVDGEQIGAPRTYTSGFSASSGDLYIGQYSSAYRWEGGIDDMRLYAGSLSQADIQKLYRDGQSIIGDWKFEESEGDTAVDSSGLDNDGTIVSAVRTQGPSGQALSFNGIDDYVDVLPATSFGAQQFTVAAWLNPQSGTRTCAYMRRVGGWHIRTSGGEWDIILEGGDRIRSGYNFPQNEWHHYAVSIDNISKTVVFYVDGEQVGDPKTFSNGFSDLAGRIYIGQYSSSYRWEGGIDDVKLYRKVLSPGEVKGLFMENQTLSGHWPFDEDGGDIAMDDSGFERHGAIVSAQRIEGPVNGALEFDGVNSYVEVPPAERFGSGVFTAAAWLKSENGTRTCAWMRRIGGWHIRTSGGQLDLILEGGGRIASGHYFPAGEWHHYAVVVDNYAGTIAFYVDGQQAGDTHTYTEAFSEAPGTMYIGQYSASYRWEGGIDDPRFYSSALTQEDIAALYDMGTVTLPDPATESCIGKWNFNETEGNTAIDTSDILNDGTIIDAERISGPESGALRFDGVNSYVNLGDRSIYSTDVFTVAAWLFPESGTRTCAYMRRVNGWHIRTSGGQWDIIMEGGSRVASGYYFPQDQWHHYAVTVNNIDQTVTFYVDGEQYGDVHSFTSGFGSSGGGLYIGQYSPSYRWEGGIDNVEFYNYELSLDEIMGLAGQTPQ